MFLFIKFFLIFRLYTICLLGLQDLSLPRSPQLKSYKTQYLLCNSICHVQLDDSIFRETSVQTLRKKCSYSELFWSVFSRILTEYREILRISPYSARMRENTDQNNSKYCPFLRSERYFTHIILGKILC